MSKATITYVGNAENPSAWGHSFAEGGKPLETSDETVIAKARANPYFEVKGGPKEEEKTEQPVAKQPKITARERGAEAQTTGKARSVPVAYRGKSEEQEWLAGYDAAAVPAPGLYPYAPTQAEADAKAAEAKAEKKA